MENITKILALSGVDCCGKNSVMHALAKEYDYKYFMMPRSPICNMIYDRVYNRNTFERDQHNSFLVEDFLNLGAYFILITAKPEILLDRAIKRNEQHVNDLETFKKHQALYLQYFKMFKERYSIDLKDAYGESNKFGKRFIIVDNSGDLQTTISNIKSEIDKDE